MRGIGGIHLPRHSECGILKAVAIDPQASRNKRAAVFFGAVLCLLLAFFAVERRVAAYPTHNLAATVTAATGVQKPEQIPFAEPQSVQAPLLFVCALALCAAVSVQGLQYAGDTTIQAGFPSWAPAPLAIRPPPTL